MRCPGCRTVLPSDYHSQTCGRCARQMSYGTLVLHGEASDDNLTESAEASDESDGDGALEHVPDPEEGEFEGACNVCGGSHCYCARCGASFCIICEVAGCRAD